MVGNGAFSHKIDYFTIYLEILNLEVHPNCITGSQVTAILLNGWILSIGGVSAVEGLRSTGLPRLVFSPKVSNGYWQAFGEKAEYMSRLKRRESSSERVKLRRPAARR